MTEIIDTDILVAGGGIAGLAAAARLAADGHRVVCVDPRPRMDESEDRRTTAFLMPAVHTFERAGAWDAMADGASALEVMRIVGTDTAAPSRPVSTTDFVARELGEEPFGYNVENAAARRALIGALEARHARLIDGARVERTWRRSTETVAALDDGRRVRAKLIVAADGRDSRLREEAGIRARRWAYGQTAIVLTVLLEAPHYDVSTEIHRPGGPLVLVPMPDRDGRPRCSVVWLNDTARARDLAALDDAALGRALTGDTMDLFGPLEVVGERAVWPIVSQLASRMVAERLALVGEPAHVVPPTGAQGANMSLADVEALAGRLAEARASGGDIGGAGVLSGYQAARWPEIAARVGAVDVLNRVVRTDLAALAGLRRGALGAVDALAPARRLTMRLGLGAA